VRMGNLAGPGAETFGPPAQMRASNEEVLSGQRQVPFTAPVAVLSPAASPGQLL